MHLYNTSLIRGGAAVSAVYGNFTGTPKAHEIVVNHGTWLEVIRIDSQGMLVPLGSSEAFGLVRAIAPLRTAGSQRDYVVVGSDSGRLSVLEFSPSEQQFRRVKAETFGKSGVRRIVPGQYVAVDPAGRCTMIAAVEKQKLVFNVARDNADRLVIASPLEAHKQNTLVLDLEALHVGLDNPTFAAIELNHAEPNSGRAVVLYEVEEGLNHVVRKAVQPTFPTANKIIPVPGGGEGPGGLFVCGEDYIEYHRIDQDTAKEAPLRARIPTRVGSPEGRSVLVVAWAMSHRKTKAETSLFFLVQTELGDLFKVEVEVSGGDKPMLTGFSLQYFDTCPVGRSLCITKRGYLFLASEFGSHRCYRFDKLGGADDKTARVAAVVGTLEAPELPLVSFAPRANRNISLSDGLESLAPAVALRVAELFGEERNQILVASGRGSRSALRILRHGLEVTEVAVTDLGGTPRAVWTVGAAAQPTGARGDRAQDELIVVSFANVTMVLAVGEASVEQATDSGLKTEVPTLAVQRLADGSIVQIHPHGLHRTGGAAGWTVPSGAKVDCAAVNERQVALGLEGGQVVYFELDASSVLQQQSHQFGEDVKCMALGAVAAGSIRSPFLVVGTFTNSLQVLSLDPADMFAKRTMQALPDQANSLALVELDQGGGHPVLTLCAGLRNGVLVRSRVDEVKGTIRDTRSIFLGSAPVKCVAIQVAADESPAQQAAALARAQGEEQQGKPPAERVAPLQNALLALSTRPWAAYSFQGKARMVPLSCQTLTHAANFVSSICDGVVSVAGSSLHIFELEDLGQTFNAKTIKLEMTPRQMLVHERSKTVVLLEGDHNAPAADELVGMWAKMKAAHDDEYPDAPPAPEDPSGRSREPADGAEQDEEDDDDQPALCVEEVGLPKCTKSGDGRWASHIRLLDPRSGNTLAKTALGADELAVSACLADLGAAGEEFLVVGTVTGLRLHPLEHRAAAVKVFRIAHGKVNLLHSTPVEGGIPRACCPLQGMVAVGIGNAVRVMSLGQSKLLLKAELKALPTSVCFLRASGNRVYAGDVHESVHLLKFSPSDLTLSSFADDTVPRLCVAGEVLDFDTVAGSDKFGNLFVLRLPSDVGDADVDNVGGDRVLWDQAKQSGAPNKLDLLAQFYLGELATGLHKATLVPGKAEALVYCTVMGTVGALVPFGSKADLEFFSLLEMHLRTSVPELVGREHLPFRSYFSPVKGVVDGDLCQLFESLAPDVQLRIAGELDRSPAEVAKKIADFKGCLL